MLKKVWRPWSAGTSLPDTFASKTAAQQDPHVGSPEVRPLTGWPGGMAVDWVISGIRNCSCGTCRIVSIWNETGDRPTCFASQADASVGNVTGSNSVNVFLGLGMSTSQITGADTRKGVGKILV